MAGVVVVVGVAEVAGGNRGNPCLPHSHRCAADAHVASARGPSVRRNDEANGCCSGAGRGFRREPAVGRLDGPTASARCDKVQFDRAAACSQVKRHGGHVVAARRGLLSDLDALVCDCDTAATECAVRVRQDRVPKAGRSLSFGGAQGNPGRFGSC